MPYPSLGGPNPNVNKPTLTTPAMQANFTLPANTNAPYFFQDGYGMVHMGGQCLSGAGTGLQQLWAAGTLSPTQKPILSGVNGLFFPIAASDGTLAVLEVATGGAVWVVNCVASKTWTFDGVSWLGGY